VRNSQAVEVKRHITKHLPPVPVFFNEPEDLTGWCEGQPGAGRIVAIKSVLYSDGSAVRWYKVQAVKAKKLSNTKNKHFKKKRVSKT